MLEIVIITNKRMLVILWKLHHLSSLICGQCKRTGMKKPTMGTIVVLTTVIAVPMSGMRIPRKPATMRITRVTVKF